ncbi:hypothetical protein DL93DRAFT_849749 [Clavulina sp. PMI_390]|nr:hypothetical protein DL93DRAFT_849749 [Clavulina sp. PMI_390]
MPSKYQELPSTIFTLTQREYKDTRLRDADGRVMYWIETTNKVTRVFRPSPNSPKECIAELEFHMFDTSTVSYAGTKQPVKDMFPRKKLATGRKAQTPMGEGVWNTGKQTPFLRIDKRLIAKYESNKHTFQQSSPATLSVANEALYFLDLIIVGWVMVMRDLEMGEKGEAIGGAADAVGSVLEALGS